LPVKEEAMNLWRVKDMYGRFYYYEDEALAKKRHKAVLVKAAVERHAWQARDPSGKATPFYWQQPEGHHAVYDVWTPMSIEQNVLEKAISKGIQRWEKMEAIHHYNLTSRT
jgi:hypothetical protein